MSRKLSNDERYAILDQLESVGLIRRASRRYPETGDLFVYWDATPLAISHLVNEVADDPAILEHHREREADLRRRNSGYDPRTDD
jgi:hypothetical protein